MRWTAQSVRKHDALNVDCINRMCRFIRSFFLLFTWFHNKIKAHTFNVNFNIRKMFRVCLDMYVSNPIDIFIDIFSSFFPIHSLFFSHRCDVELVFFILFIYFCIFRLSFFLHTFLLFVWLQWSNRSPLFGFGFNPLLTFIWNSHYWIRKEKLIFDYRDMFITFEAIFSHPFFFCTNISICVFYSLNKHEIHSTPSSNYFSD